MISCPPSLNPLLKALYLLVFHFHILIKHHSRWYAQLTLSIHDGMGITIHDGYIDIHFYIYICFKITYDIHDVTSI